MEAVCLQHWIKHVFMNHCIFLPLSYPFQRRQEALNWKEETKRVKTPTFSWEVYESVKHIQHELCKPYKANSTSVFKKTSIFWDLPYWTPFEVRHCLNVIDIENNIRDGIVWTLLNILKKMNNGLNVQKSITRMVRKKLERQHIYLSLVYYTLLKPKMSTFYESLLGLEVPTLAHKPPFVTVQKGIL